MDKNLAMLEISIKMMESMKANITIKECLDKLKAEDDVLKRHVLCYKATEALIDITKCENEILKTIRKI